VPDDIWFYIRGQGVSWDEVKEGTLPWNRRKRGWLEGAQGGGWCICSQGMRTALIRGRTWKPRMWRSSRLTHQPILAGGPAQSNCVVIPAAAQGQIRIILCGPQAELSAECGISAQDPSRSEAEVACGSAWKIWEEEIIASEWRRTTVAEGFGPV
jgi:hypothetical protein